MPRVSLLIKSCVMEWRTIAHQVRHIVGQLEGPGRFCERILVVDSRRDGFLRQYTAPDGAAHERAVEGLITSGVIDRVLYGPTDVQDVRRLNLRWFGVRAAGTHAMQGEQVASSLWGFESAAGDYVLQVDSDVLVGRRDRAHDYLSEMIGVLQSDPLALTVSLNICHGQDMPYTPEGPAGPWRVEVRASLFDRRRLLAARPLPNEMEGETLVHSWYRALDRMVRSAGLRSYRGGNARTFYIHPPNSWKADRSAWMAVLDRVEQGFIPAAQQGAFDLAGPLDAWLGPKRPEPFIFVICGRDVSPGRFRRCLDSVLGQSRTDWGAVIIDDASDPDRAAYIEICCRRRRDRITHLRLRERRGMLPNLFWAIRHVCTDPESVILTLDMEDSLLGERVIERVAREYESGADVTIGSMLRTDKHAIYPARLSEPRRNGGGNVWQHLRTFRKRLFDAIPDDYLRVNGSYPDLATDWAYMVPIVEMASHPVHIPEPLYLYEPFGVGKGEDRPRREATIRAILAKDALAPGRLG